MNVSNFNVWAILVALIANQTVGAIWYSPLLFASSWIAGVGKTPQQLKQGPPARPFVVSLLTGLVLVVTVAYLVNLAGAETASELVALGLVLGVGISAMADAPHYTFAGWSLKLYLINLGMTVVNVVVIALIVGLWR